MTANEYPKPARFATLPAMCRQVYDIALDSGPSYESKLRLITTIMQANAALWGAAEMTDTGGGGGVDERNIRVSE